MSCIRLASVNVPCCFQLHSSSLLLAAAMRAAQVLLSPDLTTHNPGTGRRPDLKEVTFLLTQQWSRPACSKGNFSTCCLNHRLIPGGTASASSWHIRLSLEPSKIFFSDIELSCIEYLIYHFLNIKSITFLYKESLPISMAVILKTFLYVTALASAAALGQHMSTACSHEHCLGNLCECLAVLWRQPQLVRAKTNTCPAPNHSQCPNGPSREKWSADASVHGKAWPSFVLLLKWSNFLSSHHPSSLLRQMSFPQAWLSPSLSLFPVTNHGFIRFCFCFERPSWSLYLKHLFRKCKWGQWVY